MMTWPCPVCGKPCLSAKEASEHCDHSYNKPTRTCPECGGSGEKRDWLGSPYKCPRCGGKGYVSC